MLSINTDTNDSYVFLRNATYIICSSDVIATLNIFYEFVHFGLAAGKWNTTGFSRANRG